MRKVVGVLPENSSKERAKNGHKKQIKSDTKTHEKVKGDDEEGKKKALDAMAGRLKRDSQGAGRKFVGKLKTAES